MFKDAVLAKEWLPVAYSQDIGTDPLAVKVLEERVVLFRVRGTIKAFKDLCIHRGAALSLGKVKDNCIVCPYHGWEYNVDGQCTKIPQQSPNRAIPLKAKAIVYQCREEYGMVWVRLSEQGSDAAEPFPYYEEYDHSSFKTVHAYSHTMNAAAPRVVENFLDVSHLAFVHEGSLGHPDYTEIPDYKVHWRDNHYISDEIEVYADADGTGNWSTIYYTFEILRPTVARLKKVNYQTNEIFSMLFAVLPQEQLKSTVFALVSRNYELDKPDEYFQEFQQLIIEQDTDIVESQKPEELPLDLQAELHLNPDRVSIAYRKWLGEIGVEFGSDVGRKAKTI